MVAGSPTACRSTAVERPAATVRQERQRSALTFEEASHLSAHLRGAQITHALGENFLKRRHEGDKVRTRLCSFELQNEEKRPQAHGIDNQAVHQFLRCRKTLAVCQRTRRGRLRWCGFQLRSLYRSGAEQRMVCLGGKGCELRHPGSCAILARQVFAYPPSEKNFTALKSLADFSARFLNEFTSRMLALFSTSVMVLALCSWKG